MPGINGGDSVVVSQELPLGQQTLYFVTELPMA